VSAEPRYLVSALVTVYGAERFMRGLLADLESQTIADRLQIVIVDSASPTNERAIVEEFQRRHDNIVYVRTEEREGILAAMNRAIALAEGRYVTPASADDRHRCDAFERLVAVLESSPDVGLAYADSAITRSENETFESAHARGRLVGHFRWPDFDARRLFQVCCVGPQPMWRRALHERHGVFDPGYVTAGDYDLYLRFAAAGVVFRHLPEVLGLYLLAPQGNEYSNQELSCAESEQARIRHWPPAWGERPAPGGYYLEPIAVAPEGAAVTPAPAGGVARPAPACAAASERPLVSVIVPTRDRPAWLRRALESVCRQTYPRLEIIVVNDGGVEVESIVRELGGRRPIVTVSLGESRERSAARNAGLALARGVYVAYLDDDDWYYPMHLERLVGALEESGAAVAYSDAWRVTEAGQGTTYVVEGVDRPYSHAFERERLHANNFIPLLCIVHRRDSLARTGGFDEELHTHEDWDLLLRLARHHDFLHVPEVTCAFSWRNDGSSTTSRMPDDFARTRALVRARYAADAAGPGGPAQGARAALAAAPRETAFLCSIVVVVQERVEDTVRCLTALAQHTTGVHYEVVVVDDASSDGTAAFLASLSGDLQVLRNDVPVGLARARNQGARAARGSLLVFLHADVLPAEGWLAPLVTELVGDPAVAVAGSRLLYPDGSVQQAGLAFSRLDGRPYPLYQHRPADLAAVKRRRELQAVSGACMVVRRELFDAVDGFTEEGPDALLADADLCLKIGERGARIVYQPRSTLVHLEADGGEAGGDGDRTAGFRERWQHRVIEDEDVVYAADGQVLRTVLQEGRERCELTPLAEAPDRASWERLIAAQRAALADGPAAAVALLAEPEAWPADVGALDWAARLCERAGLLLGAERFWQRVRALVCEPVPGAAPTLASPASGDGAQEPQLPQ